MNNTIEPTWKKSDTHVCAFVFVRTFMFTMITIPKYAKFPSNHKLPPCSSNGMNDTNIKTKDCHKAYTTHLATL